MRAWMICCLLALLVACSDDAETTSDINLDTSADASADTTPNDIASTTDAAVDTPSAPAVDPCEDMGPDAVNACLLYTSPSPRDRTRSRMPSSA